MDDDELQPDHSVEDIAKYAEDRAEELLDKATRIGGAHGPQAALGELAEAGALITAAAQLRKRAK